MQTLNTDTTILSSSEEAEFLPLKQMITKKTLRGRKIKSPLPQEQRCSICLEFSNSSSEPLISCNVCKAILHSSCYHKEIPSAENFICERCLEANEQKRELSSYHCFICDQCDGILVKNLFTGAFYHKICMKLIPELNDANSMEDVTREQIRKWRYKNSCRYCQSKLSKSRAVIKCSNTKCKEYYHIPCAIEKGMIFSTEYLYKFYNISEKRTLPFFCSCHNKKLAAAYRRDVIFGKKQKFPSQRKLSTISEDMTNCNSICDQKKSKIVCDLEISNFFDSFGEGKNNLLDLNFNELMFGKSEDEQSSQIDIDFSSFSPRENIPLDFVYDLEL